MGVPALFRWLSRKYPKIVLPVVEEQPEIVTGEDGTQTEIPVDSTKPNPNGQENDCLYLDMNGIVHPCTHPEGKPAPSTEGEMMMEVFKYTERVVKMARPRKVLFMAIDGVAPRAKMNQQRSRRFRAADEAKIKAKEKEEAIKEWEAMGKVLSEEYKNAKAWDTNAITPGTPFMDLLAQSLRYWVAYKMNTDPSWSTLQVFISDASVPGEGEHKIVDFVRRQRSQPTYNANTTHVFYGLDADLIMLSLATHEPHFKILREDVFAQGAKRGCHKCGQPGHHSAQCTGATEEQKAEQEKAKLAAAMALKPFIFLDVSILREYLQIELDVPGVGFFDLERAIDDWVFMIFFVGNDFLPHLPSLDIREGAIDMLLKIWRDNLASMGGYLTNNGKVELSRAQIIMDGLASREDEIFRKRRETEQRQEQADQEKRRRTEGQRGGLGSRAPPPESHDDGPARNGVSYVPVLQETKQYTSTNNTDTAAAGKPAFVPSSTASNVSPSAAMAQGEPQTRSAPGPGPPKPKNPMFLSSRPNGNGPIRGRAGSGNPANGGASGSLMGSSKDMVMNRAAIRKANLSAAEMLKAELAGQTASNVTPDDAAATGAEAAAETAEVSQMDGAEATEGTAASEVEAEASVPIGDDAKVAEQDDSVAMAVEPDGTVDALLSTPAAVDSNVEEGVPDSALAGDAPALAALAEPLSDTSSPSKGKKRSADEAGIASSRSQAEKEDAAAEAKDGDESSSSSDEEDEDAPGNTTAAVIGTSHVPKPLKMLGNNMVEQEDTVKLWEPDYKERYYQQKFSARIEDADFRRSVAKSYVEGLCWVLAYYYTGCPSWTWYYPYHFAPFASDFTDLTSMDIDLQEGQPFRPFEQLMGVFPAASRAHLPMPFQLLMTEEDSEIIDFYPEEFHIDMNGKKMLWQGVALLPFIDEKRLLGAMANKYPELTEDENRRNSFGKQVVFVNEDHPMYDQISSLYMKRKIDAAVPVDPQLGQGFVGTVLPDENCVPNSTFINPLPEQPLSDIKNDRSISANWWMPEQLKPHSSVLLPNYKPLRRVLTPDDIEAIKHGSERGGGRDRHRRGPAGDGFHAQRRAFEGNGGPRRDARDVANARGRHSGPPSSQRQDGWSGSRQDGPPSGWGGRSDDRSRPPSQQQRDPYGGYGGYGSQPPYQADRNGASSYGSYGGYGGGYAGGSGSRGGQAAPPQRDSQPSGGYGGYGGYGGTSYPPAPPQASAPPYQQSQYGSYGAYQPPAPPSSYSRGGGPGYGYNPPPPAHHQQYPPAPQAQQHQQGYLPSYGGGYGAPPPPANGQPPYQPPGQYSQYSNHGSIVPPHLRNDNQNQHSRWSR